MTRAEAADLICDQIGSSEPWSGNTFTVAVNAVLSAVIAEREACAKIADAIANGPHESNPAAAAAESIAEAIRARGAI